MNDHITLPQVNISANMIHLGLGQPSNSLLPLNKIKNAASHSLSANNPFFLAYGKEQGNTSFREALAQFFPGMW